MGFNNNNSHLNTKEYFIQFKYTAGVPYYKLRGVEIAKRYMRGLNGDHKCKILEDFLEILSILLR